MEKTIKNNIENALDEIRPFLKNDGGDISLVEIKDTTVNEWGCVPEYKLALEKQLGKDALEKFDKAAQANMKNMNKYSEILYSKFKNDILKL